MPKSSGGPLTRANQKWLAEVRACESLSSYADSSAQNGKLYCTTTGEMTYGRHVGICYAGDTNLNEQMVLHGWGVAYDRYTPGLVPAEKRARALQRGMWKGVR